MNRHHSNAGLALARTVTLSIAVTAAIVSAQSDCGDWTLAEPPAGALAVIGVEARSADDAWAVAYFNPNPKDVIHWDGTSWSEFSTDAVCNEYAAISVEALDLVGPSHLFVAARASTGPFSTDQLLLIWDGESWDNCNTLTLQPNIQGAPRTVRRTRSSRRASTTPGSSVRPPEPGTPAERRT